MCVIYRLNCLQIAQKVALPIFFVSINVSILPLKKVAQKTWAFSAIKKKLPK
jgi:hypothetical protein